MQLFYLSVHEHSDTLWRDCCGFVVSDRFRHFNVEIQKERYTSILNEIYKISSNVNYFSITKSNFFDVFDYDQTIGVINREIYLNNLWKINGVIWFKKICKSIFRLAEF